MRLYRAAERFPPKDGEYRPPAARGRTLPTDATEEMQRSWDALSAWDSVPGAREACKGMRSARFIVAYDIPNECGVHCEASGAPGHFDIRGDLEELKRYLDTDFKVDVEREDTR